MKMKLANVNLSTYINYSKEINSEDLKFKIGDIVTISKNIKAFLQKAMLQIVLKNFLQLKKLKAPFRRHMLLVVLKVTKLLERFTKKNYKNQIKKSLESKT